MSSGNRFTVAWPVAGGRAAAQAASPPPATVRAAPGPEGVHPEALAALILNFPGLSPGPPAAGRPPEDRFGLSCFLSSVFSACNLTRALKVTYALGRKRSRKAETPVVPQRAPFKLPPHQVTPPPGRGAAGGKGGGATTIPQQPPRVPRNLQMPGMKVITAGIKRTHMGDPLGGTPGGTRASAGSKPTLVNENCCCCCGRRPEVANQLPLTRPHPPARWDRSASIPCSPDKVQGLTPAHPSGPGNR